MIPNIIQKKDRKTIDFLKQENIEKLYDKKDWLFSTDDKRLNYYDINEIVKQISAHVKQYCEFALKNTKI